jgi:hypothetical protein
MPQLNSPEFIQLTLTSFDPKCRSFAFLRAFPVAVYVDADRQSPEVGRELSEFVGRILSELGFEIQEVRTEDGSFCQLNICQSRVPLDEPSLHEKIARAQAAVAQRLAEYPIKSTAKIVGSSIVAVVAIGTVAHIVQNSNLETVTIGRFVLPANVWVPLLIAKETRAFLKDAREIFVESRVARKALREAKQQPKKIKSDAPPPPLPSATFKQTRDRDDRIGRLETTLRDVQEELDSLKNE